MISATQDSQNLPMLIVATVALVAAIIDVRSFKVHNRLTVPLVLTGLLFHTVQHGVGGFAFSLLGLLVGFFTLIVFYALGGIGAGDVKLMSGVGAWLGIWLTLDVIIIAGLATGLYSLALILYSGGWRSVWTNFQILIFRVRTFAIHFGAAERVEKVVADVESRHRRLVPFAAMVLMGVVAVICGADVLLQPK